MIFYAPGIDGLQYTLDEEESAHAARVLRLKAGDEIVLVDGRGGWYRALIIAPHHKHCEVEVTDRQDEYGKRPYYLHIGIAPTKNIDRFEWFVEKATEIGIDEITPLLCEHSERKQLNTARLQRIMIAAMKQSKKAYLPRLNEITPFAKWLDMTDGNRFIAYCGEGEKKTLKDIYKAGENATVAIGPEGDFSDPEIARVLESGYKGVSLGTSRLRTETAGIAACHSIFFMNE